MPVGRRLGGWRGGLPFAFEPFVAAIQFVVGTVFVCSSEKCSDFDPRIRNIDLLFVGRARANAPDKFDLILALVKIKKCNR